MDGANNKMSSKCKVLRYGRMNTGIDPLYSMYGEPIESVNNEKDLGIVFSKDLKVANHCGQCYSKANRMLGLISRTIRHKNPSILLSLYKSLVRPHLDYCCSSVWNPHYCKDKALLERVQHRFTRLFSDLKTCRTRTGSSNLVCGHWKKGGTDQI